MDTVNAWRIMIAIDESPNAFNALDHAAALARALHAQLAIVHAVDVRAAIMPDVGIASEEILQGMRDAGKQALDRARKRLAPSDPFTTMLVEGVVPDEIIAAAKKWGATHLVVGTHGRTGLSRLFLGSTAENIVRHSSVPVIVVPTRPAS
jgi:nucleotide-binding universal stress UspA family protein